MQNTHPFGPTLAEIYQQTLKNPEVLDLGNSMFASNLPQVVGSINEQMVKRGDAKWRLPTLAELRESHIARDNRFGSGYVWSGEFTHEDRGDTLWAMEMSSGEEKAMKNFSEIRAVLVKGDIKP